MKLLKKTEQCNKCRETYNPIFVERHIRKALYEKFSTEPFSTYECTSQPEFIDTVIYKEILNTCPLQKVYLSRKIVEYRENCRTSKGIIEKYWQDDFKYTNRYHTYGKKDIRKKPYQ